MPIHRTLAAVGRIARIALVVAAVYACAACTTVPIPPPYTQPQLKAICERQGGWWHDDPLMGRGFCEYQAAFLQQAP